MEWEAFEKLLSRQARVQMMTKY
eukprot:COSAG06_NODE_1625_length_8891_cov_55.617379_8_plen_22_part_01